MAHHYFFDEVDFLARQSMIMGDYHANDEGTEENIHRLRFLEKSILIELAYIRTLEEMTKCPDEFLAANYAKESAASTTEFFSNGTTECGIDEDKKYTLREMITNTISLATWPSLASLPTKIETSYKLDHDYDFDWSLKHGFSRMYHVLECSVHARDQNKPMYTPEMWGQLWALFQESTLYPFPIPKAHECPEEPFHAAYTKDGKGRGVFASRNISKGSLVHAGYPNTVFFLDAESWFRFVSLLPKMIACDVLEWVWQQDLTNSGNVVLCLNLDKAAFMNNGGEVGIDEKAASSNIYRYSSNIEVKEPASLDFYAVRDIQIEQEITYDYERFEFDTSEMEGEMNL